MLRIRNTLRENVLVRLLLCVIIGIIISDYTIDILNNKNVYILLFLCLLILLFYVIKYLNKQNVTFHTLNGISIYALCILTFIVMHYNNQEINQTRYHKAIQDSILHLKIKDDPVLRNHFKTYPAKIIYQNKSIADIKLNCDSTIENLSFNEIIILKNKITNLKQRDWPGSFDFKKHSNNNHIYHQININKDDIISIKKAEPNYILEFSYNSRNALIEILRKNLNEESVFELSAALLLGYRADLDKEIMNTFSKTGTIHIISVSGLHVGIIFIVLQFIVRRTRIIKNKIIESGVLIISIWMYSLLTGLPPSVCRCSTMISFGIIARVIDNRTSAYNMLAGSALILLTIDTNMLFDIGFQLSYLAVLGILYLQKWIDNLIYIKNKYVQQVWVMTSVSIAAQLFTLPFCLYYFHQFPNYFIPANMLAIPLSSMALYTSVLTIIAGPFSLLIELCDFILKWSITIMNTGLNKIATLPYSVSENIYIDKVEAIILSIYITFFILLFVHKYRSTLKYIILVFIVHTIYVAYIDNTIFKRNYISHNYKMPIYAYRENNNVRHVISVDLDEKIINKYLKSWKNIGHFKHEVYLFNRFERVELKNDGLKILITDRKNLNKFEASDIDYMISNSWYMSDKIKSRYYVSNKEIIDTKAINTSKSGFIEF